MGKFMRIWRDKETKELYDNGWRDANSESLNIVYDTDTKIIYYKFNEKTELHTCEEVRLCKVGFMSPYINENGKLCKYEEGQIIEIG